MTTAVTHCFCIFPQPPGSNVRCTVAPPIVYALHWASAVPELSIDHGVPALLTSLRKHERYRHHFGGARASSDTATRVLGDFTLHLCPWRLAAAEPISLRLH